MTSHGSRVTSPEHCGGAIGGVTVAEVRVPPGATCRLRGTTVSGNVSIGVGGTLVVRRAAINGDVEGQGARHLGVAARSSIGGNVELAQGGSVSVSQAEIRGDLQSTMQRGQLTVRQTLIRGDLQLDQNSGGLIIAGNRIGGDLRCFQNSRMPVRGANLVAGHREGQCALTPGPGVGAPRLVIRPPSRRAAPRPPCAGDSVSDDPSDDQCDN